MKNLSYLLPVVVVAGMLLALSGCGGSQAANAQVPPPQSLSEPVRLVDSEAVQTPPAIPSSNGDAYAAQKAGESKPLPQAPAPVATQAKPQTQLAPAASAASLDNREGKYHVLAKGETVYAVARMYNVKPKDIIAANQFKDPNHLVVGTKIFIPSKS
jgi:LysM repeat protein